MTEETGTLAELNVQPGDVVECVQLGVKANNHYVTVGRQYEIQGNGWFIDNEGDLCFGHSNIFRLVSRATLKTWGEMTDEEKGALLLAEHRGEVVEWIDPSNKNDKWDREGFAIGLPVMAYRVRPPELKRETVCCWWNGHNIHRKNHTDRTHRITFDLIDGKPDCASIRMEEL